MYFEVQLTVVRDRISTHSHAYERIIRHLPYDTDSDVAGSSGTVASMMSTWESGFVGESIIYRSEKWRAGWRAFIRMAADNAQRNASALPETGSASGVSARKGGGLFPGLGRHQSQLVSSECYVHEGS